MKIAIISDIHEDIERLRKAMSIIEKNNIDEIVCLGDIVGFSVPHYNHFDTKNASECIQIVKSNCKIVIAGNHDLYEARKIPENKSEFNFPDNWYSLDYQERKKLANGKLWLYEENSLPSLISKKEREYLYNLPEYVISDFTGQNILFSHFIYPDIIGSRADYGNYESRFKSHIDFMKKQDCSLSFFGHAHIEGIRTFTTEKSKVKSFGKLKIINEPQAFIVPCIVKGKQKNGITIFNTITMELNIIRLR